MRRLLLLSFLIACNGAGSDGGDSGPLEVRSIDPVVGSVGGGTKVTLDGGGFTATTKVTIGGADCGNVTLENGKLSCITADMHFQEGVRDVVVTNDRGSVTLPAAYTFSCLWTTQTSGRQSCGAAPGGMLPSVTVNWLSEDMSGFVANADGAGTSNMADTSDHAIGTQSAYVETDGIATPRTLSRMGAPAVDFTGQNAYLWVKVEHPESLAYLDVFLGDSNLRNAFKFHVIANNEQIWLTDGDWTPISLAFTPDNYTVSGTPNRAAITDVMIRAIDKNTGVRVKLHVNAVGMQPEPMTQFPNGVVSFTFDDNYIDMVNPGASTLAAHNFPGTGFIILDALGKPGRASLDDLKALQASGWDIALHADKDIHHYTRYTHMALPQVEDDLVDGRAWLIQNGFNGYNHCAYPGGEYDSHILDLASRYFTTCRSIYQGEQEVFPPADAHKLRVVYVTNAVPLASVEHYVDEAKANHEWLVLVFHKLVQTVPSTLTEWPAADFQTLVDYVAASGIDVKTMSQVSGS